MAPLEIRRYEPADADTVWDLHVRALEHAGAYDESFAHLDADLRAIPAEYLDAGGEFLVGELDGALAAMGAFQPVPVAATSDLVLQDAALEPPDEPTAVLRRMRVDPAHHRRGFGSAILAELARRARERGFERLLLDTTPRQEAAVAFYEHHGFERIGEERRGEHLVLFYERAIGE